MSPICEAHSSRRVRGESARESIGIGLRRSSGAGKLEDRLKAKDIEARKVRCAGNRSEQLPT